MNIVHRNHTSPDGEPLGGTSLGYGFQINWDDPSLQGNDEEGNPTRGAWLQDVLMACYYRAQFIGERDVVLQYLDRTIREISNRSTFDHVPEAAPDKVPIEEDPAATAKDLFG